ncbi:MAG: RNA polymerase III subunit C82 [Vezdaea aestivalis]|nr:MAG: RNA polymerase III subunit C82 [Vezdaea aestivalis]
MSKNAVELSVLLIDETYGELSSLIFATLLRFGRLQVSKIAQRASLSASVVRSGLIVLLQHNLILCYIQEEGEACFYEADLSAAYALIRSGKYISSIEDAFGKQMANIATSLLYQGQEALDDIYSAANNPIVSTGSNAIDTPNAHRNGDMILRGDQVTAESDMDSPLRAMNSRGFFQLVGPASFRPSADNYFEAEGQILNGSRAKLVRSNAKEKAEVNLQAKLLVEEWREDGRRIKESMWPTSHTRKRAASDVNSIDKSKKLKTGRHTKVDVNKGRSDDIGGSTQNSTAGDAFDAPKHIIRLNFDKYLVVARNEALTRSAKERLGKTTAKIYRHLLDRLTAQVGSCHNNLENQEDSDSPARLSFCTSELVDELSPALSLSSMKSAIGVDAIQDKTESHVLNGAHKPYKKDQRDNILPQDGTPVGRKTAQHSASGSSKPTHVQSNGNVDDSINGQVDIHQDRTPSGALTHALDLHLQLLAEDNISFVERTDDDDSERWTVNFEAVIAQLRQQEIENIACEKFGDLAFRMIRFLRYRGKMEEKQIQASILLNQKQIRATLATLYSAGFLESQEVPRDNARQISRNIFLWFFDAERCRQVILDSTYKAMSRALQRIKLERGQLQSLLEKADRSDVKGREADFLSPMEQNLLREWNRKEGKILLQVSRLDDLVALFGGF